MSYLGTTEIGKIFLGSTEIGKAYLGNSLVYTAEAAPNPLQFVDYIESDGVAYINTEILGNAPKSMEIKMAPVSASATGVMLGARKTTSGSDRFNMLGQWSGTIADYGNNANYYYGGSSLVGVSMMSSITNRTPAIFRSALFKGKIFLEIKQAGETSFTRVTSNVTSTVTTNKQMYLFAYNNAGTVSNKMPSGTRLYYVKIYSSNNHTSLVFDGVPCIYYGEYGIWDNVSNSFFGNVAGSGAFTGPITE